MITEPRSAKRSAKGERAVLSLYSQPLTATRTGPLYNAFSYPTKISPEVIALFIATHTEPGATILDPFAGSGTAGIATKLCDRPTPIMMDMATRLGTAPKWGPRHAILYDIGVLGAFISRVVCLPPERFRFAVTSGGTSYSSALGDIERCTVRTQTGIKGTAWGALDWWASR
jgi:hypothetical protein